MIADEISGVLAAGGLALDARAAAAEDFTAPGSRRIDVLVLAGETTSSARAADIRLIRERRVDVDVVVVSAAPGGRGVRKALSAGASGFVFAAEIATSLPAAILAVRAGLVAVPRQLVQQVEKPALSTREKQILGMVVLGFQNQEIAAKLHLAEATVKGHLSSTFKKLDVASRKEAAALVLDHREGLGPGILSMPRSEEPPDGGGP